MSDKLNEEHKRELREMVKEKKNKQPVEEVLSVFCQRHGLSLDECQAYYNQLVKSGAIKER